MKKTPAYTKKNPKASFVQQEIRPVPQIVADAALFVALFVVLAFQELRFEGYESEKIGLLGILAAIILGANISRIRKLDIRSVSGNPLLICLSLLIISTLISTILSLSFTRSLWGSPSRSQGLITFVICIFLFWQASQSHKTTHLLIVPALVLAAIPICLWLIFAYLGADIERTKAGSTTGNPNYLSSWLAIVLLYCAPQLYYYGELWKRPYARHQIIYLILLIMTILASIAVLMIAGSRGALLGLGIGGLTGVIILFVLRQQRVLLAGLIVGGLLLGSVYVLLSRSVDSSRLTGIARILRPYDEVRMDAWKAAVEMLARQTEPYSAADGTPDNRVGLRPLFGYGLETTEQLQSRFGDRLFFGTTTYLDRFHNFTFDTLATLGWVGLIAWILLNEAVLFLGLRWLGLIRKKQWPYWIVSQFAGSLIAIFVVPLVIPQAAFNALIPVSASLGAVGGICLWCAFQVFYKPQMELNTQTLSVISIICVILAQWVDNQFSFLQSATYPVWWIMLGMLMAFTRKPHDEILSEEERPSAHLWFSAALVSGLFLLHSMGVSVQSKFVQHETATREIPVLLLAVLFVGLLGMAASPGIGKHNLASLLAQRGGAIVLIWFIFFTLKRLISQLAAVNLNNTYSALESTTANALQPPFQLLSLTGIIAIFIAILACIPFHSIQRPQTLSKWQVGIIVIFFLIGTFNYSTNYTSAVMHQAGNGLREIRQPEPLKASDLTFEGASQYFPSNTRLRLHWLYSLTDRAKVAATPAERQSLAVRIDNQIRAVIDFEPFFYNTREWQEFSKSGNTTN